MNTVSVSLATSFMVVSFIVGLLGGYYISPTYQQTMYMKEGMGLGPVNRFIDLKYINAMAAHHRGAILLAKQVVGKSERVEVQNLIADILQNEPTLIEELYQWKRSWFNDNRTVVDPVVTNLGAGTVDDTLDLRFLNALIAHHQAGIDMAQEIRTKSSRKEILDNADAVETFLTNSLQTLKAWREQWYEIKSERETL